jgi:hypothetical protein
MKELADMMKKARAIPAGQGVKESEDFRQRLTVIRNRLETHNLLEEKQVYKWPSLLFDEKTVDELNERLQHELENLPPRLA